MYWDAVAGESNIVVPSAAADSGVVDGRITDDFINTGG
jgi:hypothetical protein